MTNMCYFLLKKKKRSTWPNPQLDWPEHVFNPLKITRFWPVIHFACTLSWASAPPFGAFLLFSIAKPTVPSRGPFLSWACFVDLRVPYAYLSPNSLVVGWCSCSLNFWVPTTTICAWATNWFILFYLFPPFTKASLVFKIYTNNTILNIYIYIYNLIIKSIFKMIE